MRWIFFLIMMPMLFAAEKIEIKHLELKILNGVRNGAAYVSIYNGNSYAVNLYKVEVDPEVFDRIELHDHVQRTDENNMHYFEMIEIPEIEIPEIEIAPGGTIFLQKGRKHLMLIGIKSTFCSYKKLSFNFFFRSKKGDFIREVSADISGKKRCLQ